MKSASHFLGKFDKLTPPNDAVRRAVAAAINAVLGTTLSKADIRVQNSVAFVSVSSVLKHKIRLERAEILSAIAERLPAGRHGVRDLR